MSKTVEQHRRDAYALSLGGMRAIASFVPAPAIAHDRIRCERCVRPRTQDHPQAVRRHAPCTGTPCLCQ